MDLKNKIDSVNNFLQNYKNTELLTKIGEVKGLYAAYEISHSEFLLTKIIELLLELIELSTISNLTEVSTKKAILNKENYTGELAGFYSYLVENAKKPTTAECYRKTIGQIMKKYSIITVNEFNSKLDGLIEIYQNNDEKVHNRHIAALLRYKEYLQRK